MRERVDKIRGKSNRPWESPLFELQTKNKSSPRASRYSSFNFKWTSFKRNFNVIKTNCIY